MTGEQYPDAPGARAIGTSQDAADAMAEDAPLLRSRALATLRRLGGMTADEVAAAMGETVLSIRPRISELHLAGEVRDSGARRTNASGKRAIVWAIVRPISASGIPITRREV
jgi:hypothetical protein